MPWDYTSSEETTETTTAAAAIEFTWLKFDVDGSPGKIDVIYCTEDGSGDELSRKDTCFKVVLTDPIDPADPTGTKWQDLYDDMQTAVYEKLRAMGKLPAGSVS